MSNFSTLLQKQFHVLECDISQHFCLYSDRFKNFNFYFSKLDFAFVSEDLYGILKIVKVDFDLYSIIIGYLDVLFGA